jgi:hypothetical protein
MVGAFSYSPILKISPLPTPATPWINARLEPGVARPQLSASRQDVAHVARVPVATACSSDASVVESVGDLLERRGASLPNLSDDRQYVGCEALGLNLASLATAATDHSEVGVKKDMTTRCARFAGLGKC